MSVSEYEKKFSELVRLVPYIQLDEVLKCKRFLSGLQHRIRVNLSVVPQNRFGDLVEGPAQPQVEATVVEAEVVPQGYRQRPALRPEFML